MPKTILVEYGQYKQGYGFGTSTRAHNNRKLHLIDLNKMSNTAVCGASTYGSRESASGYLCPDCAEILGIHSEDDLDVDQEAYDWMQAQK
jgi:hypothetical protein